MSSRLRSRSRSPRRELNTSRSRSRSHERIVVTDSDPTPIRARSWRDHVRHIPRRNIVHFHYRDSQTSLGGRVATYHIIQNSDVPHRDIDHFLLSLEGSLKQQLMQMWLEKGGINWSVTITADYYKGTDYSQTVEKYMTSKKMSILTQDDINETVEAAMRDLLTQHMNLTVQSSGWVLDEISLVNTLKIDMFSTSNNNVRGGGDIFNKFDFLYGKAWLPLPDWIKAKQCVINVENYDDKCFHYAMECAWQFKHNKHISDMKDKQRVSKYKESHFNFGNLQFPIHTSDLSLFERLNKEQYNLALHVYYADDKPNVLKVLYDSREQTDKSWHIHLLLYTKQNADNQQTDFHYAYITSVKKLTFSNRTTNRAHYVCDRCLSKFSSETTFNTHYNGCKAQETRKKVFPNNGNDKKYFKNFERQNEKPFVVYADFEAFNKKLEHIEGESVTVKNRLTHQVASGFCYYISCISNPELNQMRQYTTQQDNFIDGQTEVSKVFIKCIKEDCEKLRYYIKDYFSYPATELNDEQKAHWKAEEKCCVCNLSMKHGVMNHWLYKSLRTRADFDTDEQWKQWNQDLHAFPDYMKSHVMDDNLMHNSDRVVAWHPDKKEDNYRGACHRYCQRSIGQYGKIPVVFHNLSGYDAHIIISNLKMEDVIDPYTGKSTFNALPESGDKFKMFEFSGIQFIDSFRFLSFSLDTIVENVKKDGNDSFKHFHTQMAKDFPHIDRDTIDRLLLRKGEFPYEWFDHPLCFDGHIPPLTQTYPESVPNPNNMDEIQVFERSVWYSHLSDSTISEADYNHAMEVWYTFRCGNMKRYHDLYLTQDVLLLADCMDHFRRMCRKNNGLEPMFYVSLASYTDDNCFKMSEPLKNGTEPFCVELIKDDVVYDMFHGLIRGGVSMCPGRYAEANHKYLSDYDEKKPDCFIQYWDANNLYGYAMSEPVPTGGYVEMDTNDPMKFMMDHIDHPWSAGHGFIYDIDCFFPANTHEYLADFPPAPEKRNIPGEMCSAFYKSLLDKYNHKHDEKGEKLLCTLLPRYHYKIHYSNLKLYIGLGMKVSKVHKIIQFNQSNWLAKYIQYNTLKRAESTSALEQDFFKLLNNAFYGRMIMDITKFHKVKAVGTYSDDKKTWEPSVVNWRIVNSDLTIVVLKSGESEMTSPISVGGVVLERSKWLMYNFYYNVLKNYYGSTMRLLLTDTDSLCVEFYVKDIMADLKDKGLLKYFDLSVFPKNESYHGANYFDPSNKKVIGKFKDEDAEHHRYIKRVYAFKSKMYCLIFEGYNDDKVVAKGVNKAAKRKIREKYYKDCFDEHHQIQRDWMYRLASSNDQIYMIRMNKVLINPMDNKVYLLDMTHSLPYGHKDIPV